MLQDGRGGGREGGGFGWIVDGGGEVGGEEISEFGDGGAEARCVLGRYVDRNVEDFGCWGDMLLDEGRRNGTGARRGSGTGFDHLLCRGDTIMALDE